MAIYTIAYYQGQLEVLSQRFFLAQKGYSLVQLCSQPIELIDVAGFIDQT